jgi:putative YhdH/YhfP family quinone oxidoreductase
MKCFLVEKDDDGTIRQSVSEQSLQPAADDDLLIDVAYSSVNYKDALAASGHPGVVRCFPHVPGIDAAGTIAQSSHPSLPVGSAVTVTGYGMGSSHWGGWAQQLQVPANWVVPLPDALSMEQAMALGTAGVTAALSIQALQAHGVSPECGPVAVSGSSGGVGSLAVRILSQLGYEVIAVSRKTEFQQQLQQWGADRCWSPGELEGDLSKPMLRAELAGAIDTVGGTVLGSLLRRLQARGCLAACGMAGSDELDLTVYPFILRGVTLVGIDSAEEPLDSRTAAWNQLAAEFRPTGLGEDNHVISLSELAATAKQMLAGQTTGRTVVDVRA